MKITSEKKNEIYIASWSGGKDSCFACYRALQEGYRITCLINFISDENRRVRFHGIKDSLIQVQSRLAEIPLYQQESTVDNYEEVFRGAVGHFVDLGARGMVFGDIYLEEHRLWVERVCRELRIEPVHPLWERRTEEILLDFIDDGFEAVVVSGQAEYVDRAWIGQPLSRDFIAYLKEKGNADLCGERGEYHTLVVSGPLLKGRIEIKKQEVISRNGFWLLDIQDYVITG